MGQFYYAAKAFDVLERLDPNPEYWEGKRGACVGVFQLIIAGNEQRSATPELFQLFTGFFLKTTHLHLGAYRKTELKNMCVLPFSPSLIEYYSTLYQSIGVPSLRRGWRP